MLPTFEHRCFVVNGFLLSLFVDLAVAYCFLWWVLCLSRDNHGVMYV